MMGWWSSSAGSALDEQIARATSSSLEDIALNLEISDVIRSKTVPPKDAMRSLKKRIGDKNPNTQLSALNLTDTCVKNGGHHFLTEIASKEFMDNLVSLLKAVGPAAINNDVRSKILEYIQTWAAATEGRYELNYINEVYKTLQREGFQFPPKVTVSSSMIDSSAPPEWVDSDVCMRCRTAFTFTNRKHHCRNCGNVFDQQCSSKTLPLPHLGILQPVRVDDGCYAKLTDKSGRGGSFPQPHSPTKHHSHSKRQSSSMQPRNARVEDSFDEDLKKALAMSLEEVQNHSHGRGYVAPVNNAPSSNAVANSQSASGKATEEEDEDLKAAIAASLADMEEQKKKHAAALKESTSSAGNAASSTFALPKNDYELTPVEAENINLFSTLVDRLQSQPPGTILREPQIQELYDSIGTLRPKLARTYGETMSKHDTLLDLHSKLQIAVRYYDRMLEDRLSKAFNQHSLGGYNLPAPQQPSGPYPVLHSNPPLNVNGPAESFYTGDVPDYSRPAAQPSYGYPSQPTPQPQHAPVYDQRASSSGPQQHQYPPQQQQVQRQDSWRASAPPEAGQPNYPPSETATPQMAHMNLPPQAQQPSAPESVGTTPTGDPAASFYSQPNSQGAPSAPADMSPSPYPNLQQSMPQYAPSSSVPPENAGVAPPHQQQAAAPPAQQQPHVPYWQHPAAQHVQVPAPSSAPWQHAPQQAAQPYPGYQQEAFPSAPQHAPQQPVVEEALIEL